MAELWRNQYVITHAVWCCSLGSVLSARNVVAHTHVTWARGSQRMALGAGSAAPLCPTQKAPAKRPSLPRCRRHCAASTTAILLLPPSLPAAATTQTAPATLRERGWRWRCAPMTMRYLLKRNGNRSQETHRLGSWKDSHWGSWKDSHWHWGSRKDSHWHCSARLSNRVVLGLSAWLSARGSQRWITLRGLIVWPQRVALSVGLWDCNLTINFDDTQW